jgi:hypothetical protein
MKVRELIKVLRTLPPDLEVRIYWDGSDKNTVDGIFLKDEEPAFNIPECVVLVGEWACYEKPKNIIWGTYSKF